MSQFKLVKQQCFSTLTLIFLSLNLQSQEALSVIRTIDHFNAAKEELSKADKHTLVVFDIDDTLLTSDTFYGSDSWYEWQKDLKYTDPEYVSCKFDVTAVNYELGTQKPVENGTVEIVESVKADTIYLTARNPAYRGATERELKRNKFPFPRSLNSKSEDGLIFTMHDPEIRRDADVSYWNGIYMVSGQDKGKALLELLKRIDMYNSKYYTKVILIDDGIHNINNMQKAINKADILFEGYHYTHIQKKLEANSTAIDAANKTWTELKQFVGKTYPKRAKDFDLLKCSY